MVLKGFALLGHTFISKCRGMFAFAIWDKLSHTLTLYRDRVLAFYIQGPASIFQHVQKLEPGCSLTLTAQGIVTIQKYWDAQRFYTDTSTLSYQDAREHTRHLLEESCNLRMVSDVPVGVFSAIPTILVSQIAKEHVSVALSADGGDELFGGYTKYHTCLSFYPKLQTIPKPLRSLLVELLMHIHPFMFEKCVEHLPGDILNKGDRATMGIALVMPL